MIIAVDAAGGDYAPTEIVKGAIKAAEEFKVGIALVGKPAILKLLTNRYRGKLDIQIVEANEVITYNERPMEALQAKPNSSTVVGVGLVKKGLASAFVSAGNSGAVLGASFLMLGRIETVERPSLCSIVNLHPSKSALLLDAGANVDCKPGQLVQFGLMGSIYAERILGIKEPRVGVLSNGEEDGKGNDLTRAASEQLSATALNYIGYVEGRDIFNGKVDVIVCDGFTGNVALKTMEGMASFASEVLKSAFEKNLVNRLGYLLARRALREAYRRLDYAEYGGAPLIGLDGVGIIAHGGSNPRAIKNAIRAARDEVEQDVNRHIVDVLAEMGGETGDGLPGKIWRRLKSKIETLGEK